MTENYLYFVLISYLSALVLFVTYFFVPCFPMSALAIYSAIFHRFAPTAAQQFVAGWVGMLAFWISTPFIDSTSGSIVI